MICPDINLLLYATFPAFQQHVKSKAWWDAVLSGPEHVRLGVVVVLGFIRISTNQKIFSPPLTMEQSIGVVDDWLQQPNVKMISPLENHWDNLKNMLRSGHAGSNLTTDAHIAALAADYGLTVYTNDTDFARFPATAFCNPLAKL